MDVGVDRSLEDIDNWKARDPIARLSRAMIDGGVWTADQQRIFCDDLDLRISAAWDKAMDDPYPSQDSTLKYVYKSN